MKAAFILFDRMTSLDFIGCYDAVTRLKSMKIMDDFSWRICAESQFVVDDRGLRLEADSIGENLDSYDLLFVPGGVGTRQLQHDVDFIRWLKTAEDVPLKASVCTGSLLLGAAGFLKGRRATTHLTAFAELQPYCEAVVNERIVDEGNIVTARGVTSSIDLGLHLVQRLAGEEARSRIATQMDYPYRYAT